MTVEAKITAADIRTALKRRYAQPSCAVVFEVAQGTGTSARRHQDAVAMELWPSHGLTLYGVEIKVNRYDWRREKKDPTKAEEIARFLDEFWIAAPPGIVPADELPSAWGLMELHGGELKIARKAQRTSAQPVDRDFLAAMLRAAARPISAAESDEIVEQRLKTLEAQFNDRVERAAEHRRGQDKWSAERWNSLVEKLGENASWLYDVEALAETIKLVYRSGVTDTVYGLRNAVETLINSAEKITKAADDLGIELLPAKPDHLGELRRRTRKANAA